MRLVRAAEFALRRILPASLALGLAILAGLAAVAAGLAQGDSPDALRRAERFETRFLPSGPNAADLERLAQLELFAAEQSDDIAAARQHRQQGRQALEHAVAADPLRSAAWIRLGLEREFTGEYASAEQAFLHAAAASRLYLPAWTLANYYVRRQESAKFWPWAAKAVALVYDDYRPILALANLLEPDATEALKRLGSPTASGRLERSELDLLIAAQRWPQAEQVAQQLITRHDPQDPPRIAELASREIRAGRGLQVLGLWNAVFPPLDPESGPVLTNGGLLEEPTGSGFDWRVRACSGVDASWKPGQLAFHFSGQQPDQCELLEQPVPVADGRSYRLQAAIRFEEGRPETQDGLAIEAAGVRIPIAPGATSLNSTFPASESGIEALKLVYRRSPGDLPLSAIFTLGNIRLDVQ